MVQELISVVIPAAGVGRRMLTDKPKQYLTIHGKTILEHTVEKLRGHPQVGKVVIAVSDDDPYFSQLSLASDPEIIRVAGGQERSDSVFAALDYVVKHHPTTWVMVHDAARPCVRLSDIDRLIEAVISHDVGGILATPVRDTMKRSNSGQDIIATVERENLWHALTPQMFRTAELHRALSRVINQHIAVTDEASVMEWHGDKPRIVLGRADNIKVTQPEDLALAEFYLGRE
ncbi:2-C-methyl-D-erythritol 4-phosphate cytidylyltransferase [Vibrio gazogenes]|uniref:2-C-methyl-D-erythritol 4-phosphate cytidylyltransferase n=1 Tax=Vibrio gazogenes DSM 21264 = NBRC 103151 TaxID=1123492 RepID=A0A1M4WG84_VIBGA|nr:2-C-methyl-D-erythritol 4-phosphate cytidylyltransferase [Vibrio gazogenes]USP13221.1 2-C-methyl-D-erythritol 4-phosphate cytidylyltransferase [Vibrio gazogenes]SHE80224.1 2-C-methyl-D-erythritol 4-phosphate cytidylyltransferase [Vibrio gazogenes DSM 21264] [Vibrio gazogenes DSM 21264 = NBRC 103151]SJN54370.1 2-C-methyl-D-erythritol 4-phosphate cytidylyltransferase [Vibrio gazogenes]